MSGMNMKKMIHQARSLVGAGVEQILKSPTAVVDAAIMWRRADMAGCGSPQAVAGIMDTATDKKVQRRARKRAIKALKHAARELHRPPPLRTRTTTAWVAAGLLGAATVAGTIIMVRTLRRRQRCTDQFEVEEGHRVPGGGLAEAPGKRHQSGQPTNDQSLSVTHANVTETDSDMPLPIPPAQKFDGPDGAYLPTKSPASSSERTVSP